MAWCAGPAAPEPRAPRGLCRSWVVEIWLRFLEGESMGLLAQRFHVRRLVIESAIRQEARHRAGRVVTMSWPAERTRRKGPPPVIGPRRS